MNNLKLTIAILLLGAMSCSSPESDGEKLAEESNKNTEAYISKTIQAYNNFIQEFGNHGYRSRIEAREELNEKLADIRSEYYAKNAEIDEEFSELLAKYGEDYTKVSKMINARNVALSGFTADSAVFNALRTQASNLVLTIIPDAPDKSKLMADLVGRKIYALPGGYFSNSWVWTVENGEIKELEITQVRDIDVNNKAYDFDMTVQASGAAYHICGKVLYKLEDNDDWEIDAVSPSEVEIVKTGFYDNSITVNVSQYFLGTRFSIRNNSDAALLVGYQILENYNGWKKYSTIVAGGETTTMSVLGFKDYRIDFVERP